MGTIRPNFLENVYNQTQFPRKWVQSDPIYLTKKSTFNTESESLLTIFIILQLNQNITSAFKKIGTIRPNFLENGYNQTQSLRKLVQSDPIF